MRWGKGYVREGSEGEGEEEAARAARRVLGG